MAMRRSLVVLFVLVLFLFSASAMRHVLPGLKDATRGTVLQKGEHVTPRPAADELNAKSGGGSPPALTVVRLATRWPHPTQVNFPEALPIGSDALGVSLPKRLRWAATGGHGRHGPGLLS